MVTEFLTIQHIRRRELLKTDIYSYIYLFTNLLRENQSNNIKSKIKSKPVNVFYKIISYIFFMKKLEICTYCYKVGFIYGI